MKRQAGQGTPSGSSSTTPTNSQAEPPPTPTVTPAFINTTIVTNGSTQTSAIPNPAIRSTSVTSTTDQSSSVVPSSSADQSRTLGVVPSVGTDSSVTSTSALAPQSGGRSTTLVLTANTNATAAGPLTVTFATVLPIGGDQKTGVAPGVTAGVAIATLVIGAIIATAVMLVLQKKKKRSSRSSKLSAYAGSTRNHGHQEVAPVASKEKAVVTTETTDPDYLLPQPKDDQSMGAAANQLFVHIGNHVENFYHNDSLRNGNISTSEEDELLASRKTRFFALKRLICREMLAAISWECTPETSLFSPTAVATAKSMSHGNLSEPAYEVAWSRWRVSTALLLKSEDASHRTQAREYWLDRLQRRLEPFQLNTPNTRSPMQEDLYAICKLAENLASLVYSQPARWEFRWPNREGRDHLVIFPDFVRATDSRARRLDRPRRVLEAQSMQ